MKEKDRIPYKYRHDVHVALIAVAAVSPAGFLGDLDAVAIAGIWGGTAGRDAYRCRH